MAVLSTILGFALIAIGAAGAFNVRRARDQIVQINKSLPHGDRSRSVEGVTARCAVSAAVGLLLVYEGLG
jgi:hypothetical protein